MSTRIGDMKKVLELQKPTETSDSMGGYSTVYSTEFSVWGALWPVSAKEQIQAIQNAMAVTHRIRIRYNSELKANWRIKHKTRYFAIESIININEAGRFQELLCKEVEA